MIDEVFGHFFKAEVKSSGRRLLAEDKVSLQNGSDTFIQAFVKAAPPLKVQFSSEDIGSELLIASCTCPASQKNQFCKHVWATLLAIEQKKPDFLSTKRSIEKKVSTLSEGHDEEAASAKLRASDYRKAQYQKHKQHAKDLKNKLGRSVDLNRLPPDVQEALAYFAENGFPMSEGPSEEIIVEAKRKLSRLFHPDRGGTHTEMTELNRNCDLLINYL